MDIIEQMLTGQMAMNEFCVLLKSDLNLQSQLRSLIPVEAIDHREHKFWKTISYDTLKNLNYDIVKFIEWMVRFDGTIGDNLNIWGTIRCVYCYHHPALICTKKYEEAFLLYLNVVGDCFDGLEVKNIIESIIVDALTLKYKKQQIAKAKSEIKQAFHVIDNHRPRWIQGPEWPMGINSPMQFVSQKRCGEMVKYLFKDVDSGELRLVEQFY